MAKTIRMKLSSDSIKQAIKQLESYKARIPRLTKEITRRLAAIGLEEAQIRFSGAMYDGDNDALVSLKPTESGYEVIASGESVCFIEFGSGVHYNGSGGNYPLPKPAGIVGIGQYGRGHGSNDMWRYQGNPGTDGIEVSDATGTYVLTKGNPAQMPMYHALVQMQREVEQIVKDVFANA